MNWETLKEKIYYADGSSRDIYIHSASKDDWRSWVDFLNERYKICFYSYESNDMTNKIDLDTLIEYWDGNYYLSSAAYFFLDHIQINARFFDEGKIEKDFDPMHINSIDDHHRLIEFMKAISLHLDKEVILTPENTIERILISVHRENVKINAVILSN